MTLQAIQQYKPLIDQREALLGKGGSKGASRDRGVVSTLEMAVKALKSNPQGFNTPAGFGFFQWLDDADRNALPSETAALSQSQFL